MYVGETTCDGKKKMYELLGGLKPVYTLHLPQGLDGGALAGWTAELRRFIAFLEDRFGVCVTDAALREAARQRNAERRARLALMEVQQYTPPPISGLGLYKTLEGSGFLFDQAEKTAGLERLREAVLAAYSAGERPVPPGAKRILVTGCPIGGVLEKTVGVIEENGGAVVCFENCSGIKAAYQMVDSEAEDIVAAIAARYLEIGCAVLSPNEKRKEHLKRLVREFQVDGVVEVDLQACATYSIESHGMQELMRGLGVPYMALETDYSQSDRGQLSTRLGAFLERL